MEDIRDSGNRTVGFKGSQVGQDQKFNEAEEKAWMDEHDQKYQNPKTKKRASGIAGATERMSPEYKKSWETFKTEKIGKRKKKAVPTSEPIVKTGL